MFVATATVDIETASASTDAGGYPDRAWATSATGVRAHIANKTHTATMPDTDAENRAVRYHRILLARGTTVAKGDRIVHAGRRYIVDHVYRDHDGFGFAPVRVDATYAGSAP